MNFTWNHNDDQNFIAESEYADIGTVAVVVANPNALDGQPGPEVFATLDADRHIVAWNRRYIQRMMEKVDTVEQRAYLLGQLLYKSYEAVRAYIGR